MSGKDQRVGSGRRRWCGALGGLFVIGLCAAVGRVEASLPFEEAPINYHETKATDSIMELKYRLAKEEVELEYDETHGYLPSVLKALGIPVESQVLVFSKTSLQTRYISPRNPRALYFNDDVYIGWVRGSNIMEISAVDPRLGSVFYTLEQDPVRPRITRQKFECLQCHASSLTRGVPGHSVRSIFPTPDGRPSLSSGTYRTDHTSPLKERWGGWYVTGTHGNQTHMGNALLRGEQGSRDLDKRKSLNVTDLSGYFPTSAWLTPHSDIVALMVLGHQADVHNKLTQANFDARRALHEEQVMQDILKEDNPTRSDGIQRRLDHAAERIVKSFLFVDEAKLTDPIKGTSGFRERFEQRGPFTKDGRSLRQFDLKTRMLRFPCSFLIYSAQFDGMPDETRRTVYLRLQEILTAPETDEEYSHLSADDRAAIFEILLETKPELAKVCAEAAAD